MIEYEPESTEKDKLIAKRHSPDLLSLIPIKVNNKTTTYVTKKKLDKYGEQYFIDKVLNRHKRR